MVIVNYSTMIATLIALIDDVIKLIAPYSTLIVPYSIIDWVVGLVLTILFISDITSLAWWGCRLAVDHSLRNEC